MRKALFVATSLMGAMALSGCVVVVGDGDKRFVGENHRDGFITLDRDGGYSRIGGDIDLRGRIGGDLNLVSGDVTADNLEVGGSVNIAAGDIDFSGRVADEVSIAGGDVNFEAVGERDVDIAAGDLFVSGRVGRDASLAAGEMLVEAEIGRNLHAHADHMIIRSRVDGAVELVAAREIRRGRRDDSEHGLIVLSGDFREGGEICGVTVAFENGASIGGATTIWAETQPDLSGLRGASNVTYVHRNGDDCDDLIDQ